MALYLAAAWGARFIHARRCAGIYGAVPLIFYPRGVGRSDFIAADVGAGRDAHLAGKLVAHCDRRQPDHGDSLLYAVVGDAQPVGGCDFGVECDHAADGRTVGDSADR